MCLTGTALAQPVTRPEIEPCRVTIAYAPEDVRAEIEAWVRAEPRCERELEVRVVPAEDGLYLQARDGNGRVRERLVPDAQSAAVLVVSWMADDSLGPTHTSPILDAPSVAISDPEMPADPEAPFVAHATARPRAQRWLTLGVLGSEKTGGFRGQVDLFAGRRWSIGVGGGFRGDHDRDSHDGVGQARVLFSTHRSLGPLSIRVQLGFGADVANSEDMDSDDTMETQGDDSGDRGRGELTPRLEAGVFARVPVTRGWGLVGGPLVEGTRHEKPTWSMFLGVQRGL
jgi:hypothetical protein